MTKILSYCSLLILLSGSIPGWSQEILTGIGVNQSIRESYRQQPVLKSATTGILELPFFDDFSVSVIYPDNEKWSDRFAFINNDYPVNPVSIGVATLDAIDHTGSLYEHATTWPFLADRLTTRPIDLEYSASDSIYLSFFYQPQGKGDKPQLTDSLRLEFYSPENESWRVVWSVPGDSLHDFRLVMIPVIESGYLMEGFRFRFSNIASIADNRHNPGTMSNADHWHIDYVYLNKGRSYTDTIFRDVAFTQSPGSFLNNYEAMPWDQFHAGRLAEMGSVVPFAYRNNDNVTRSVQRHFSIDNVYENMTVHNFSGVTVTIDPGDVHSYNSDLAYSFNTGSPDSALFRIKTWLVTDDFDFKGNDTVVYDQGFNNYFALDDGTAENGYGLFGGGTENAKIAYRFRAYKADSLRAVKVFFNQSLNDASRQYFNLAVWDDNNGRPGNIVHVQVGERPVYEEELNMFHTYYLDSAVFVNQVFYVGIIQTTSEFINIGFDVNRNNRNSIFYNIDGEWLSSSLEGSLMVRPVTGSSFTTSLQGVIVDRKRGLNVYPNPATDVLYIDLDGDAGTGIITHKLFNRMGQLVFQGTGNINRIDLSPFPPGIYILQTESGSVEFETKKILITQ